MTLAPRSLLKPVRSDWTNWTVVPSTSEAKYSEMTPTKSRRPVFTPPYL
jgi:hypothetical protein